MAQKISIENYTPADFESLYDMNQKLYPTMEKNLLVRMLKEMARLENYRIFMAKDGGNNMGFSVISIRTDYVEGADGSPTGYLEAIYVEPEYRKEGIGKRLVELGEEWCKENRCSQIGSDTWISHEKARAFHGKLGFWEEDELVHFLKNLT